jgi:hypothetical protein
MTCLRPPATLKDCEKDRDHEAQRYSYGIGRSHDGGRDRSRGFRGIEVERVPVF